MSVNDTPVIAVLAYSDDCPRYHDQSLLIIRCEDVDCEQYTVRNVLACFRHSYLVDQSTFNMFAVDDSVVVYTQVRCR